MPEEFILREKACEAIRSGKLRAGRPDRTFGGMVGSGLTCAVCGDLVKLDQVELEIEFNRHGMTPGLDRYHLIRGASQRGSSSEPRPSGLRASR